MWLNFSIAFFLFIAILYIPTCYCLSGLEIDQRISISIAPAISTVCYALSGIVLYYAGIRSNPATVILPWLLIFLIAGSIIRFKHQQKLYSGLLFQDIHIPAIYILVGTLVTTAVFVASLDGATAFFQDGTDNYMHLNAVRSLAQSGKMSCLSISIYEHSDTAITNGSFYPAEWHILAALCMQLLKIEPTICINALNTVLIAVVFPLSLYSFLVSIDRTNRNLHIAGSVTALAVCSCPWEFLLWGPLYANLLGLAFILSVSSCFVTLLKDECCKPIIPGLLFIFGCLSITLAQPNCVITMGVVLAPFLVYSSFIFFKKKGQQAAAFSSIIAIAIVLFWIICRNSPLFSKVATFNWEPILDSSTATQNIARLTLIYNPAQWLVVICVALGFIRVLKIRRNRWLCFSPAFFAISYIVCISSKGLLRTYLSGFWYNDFYRIACMYGLCLIPLVTYGLEAIIILISALISKVNKLRKSSRAMAVARIVPVILFALICYRMTSPSQPTTNEPSCFDFLSTTIKYQYSLNSPTASLNERGEEFLKEVEAITGSRDLVINDPYDGSVYAYGINNINTYYRNFFFPEHNKTSNLIRTRLADISTNEKVRAAVEFTKAKYVLVLDYDFNDQSGIKYLDFYKRDEWRGIHKITEQTPGFELVLSRDGMRLYRISALD